GGDLQGQMDDAEAGGLLGDYGDVAGSGDGVGHADVQAAGGEKADVGSGESGGGARERHGIPGERAGIVGGGEDAEGGDVEVDIRVGERDASGGGVDDDDVFCGDGGRGGGERDDFVGGVGRDNDKGDAVGGGGVRVANLDGEIARGADIRGGDGRCAFRD